MTKTRSSTPKYEVVHIGGAVTVTGVSKTEATQIARAMNKGTPRERIKRLSVRPVRRAGGPMTTNQMVKLFAEILTA